jgi:N utilization substance protein A
MTIEDAEAKSEEEANQILESFKAGLDVDEDLAGILVQEGFSTIEEIAYVPENELLSIAEFDEDIVEELRRRARDTLLMQMIAKEEALDAKRPEQDLLDLDGMSEALAYALAERDVRSREDLAECAVDDLEGVPGLEPEQAAELIMSARAHWFAEEEGERAVAEEE